jgi:hypothetical protein
MFGFTLKPTAVAHWDNEFRILLLALNRQPDVIAIVRAST